MLFRRWHKSMLSVIVASAIVAGGGAVIPIAVANTDITPPAAVSFTYDPPTSFYFKLKWNAPADDGNVVGSGAATKYDLRYSTSAINSGNWYKAQEVPFLPNPGTPGSSQYKVVSGLDPSKTYYFAMRTIDDVGNVSGLSTITVTTAAQTCDVNIPFNNNVTQIYGGAGTNNSGKQYLGGNLGGKVVCLAGSTTTRTNPIEFIDVVGQQDLPVKIVNNGDVYKLDTASASYGMKFTRSKYFQLSGNGVPGSYGISIKAVGPALQVKSGSTNYELNHLKISSVNSVGMQLHSDLSCAAPGAADDYSRTGFTQRNTIVRDSLIENVKKEGIYLGNSHYNEVVQITCGTVPNTYTVNKSEHALVGVRVFNNKTDYTGWDGIQVGGGIEDVKVYNNSVKNFATDNQRFQRTGIQINPGTTGDVFNNYVQTGKGHGIMYLGRGGSSIFNNFVEGASDSGIYVDKKEDQLNPPTFAQGNIYVMNNTVKDVGTFGIEMRNDVAPISFMKNNFILMTGIGTTFNIYDNVGLIQTGTKAYYHNIANGFDTISSNTTIPTSGPPYAIVNNGEDLSAYGVTFDFYYNPRPLSGGFDRGYIET